MASFRKFGLLSDNARLCAYICWFNAGRLRPWPSIKPASTTHLLNVWPTLALRLRRWLNIGQTLGRCVISKNYAFTQCLTKVGPPSTTLARHWSNIGYTCRPPSTTLAQHWSNIGYMCRQLTQHIYPMFDQCWSSVYDVGPPLVEHWIRR